MCVGCCQGHRHQLQGLLSTHVTLRPHEATPSCIFQATSPVTCRLCSQQDDCHFAGRQGVSKLHNPAIQQASLLCRPELACPESKHWPTAASPHNRDVMKKVLGCPAATHRSDL